MASSKSRVRIDPPWKVVFPGLGWHFTVKLDGKPAEAIWVVTKPDVGTVVKETGEFWAYEGFRQPYTEVAAVVKGGLHVAKAAVHVMVGPPPSDGPVPVDDYYYLPGHRSLRWNDTHGRRAVLLMTETLMQLPREFLRAVGPVAVLRVPDLVDPTNGKVQGGMHIPFPQRVVLLSDREMVQPLRPESGEYTDEDRDFVALFIHELAHVALANRAISDDERAALAAVVGAALAAAVPTSGISLALLAGGLYGRYHAFARRDLATEYAERTGWVVNNPNPLGFLWNDLTDPPNAVTGFGPIGRVFGLRNPSRAVLPIPLGPGAKPLSDDEVEKLWEAKGFASAYAGTDVHEDFAEAVTALALGWTVAGTPVFAPRREWIVENGFWPKSWPPVEPGAVLDAWAKKHGRPLPNVYDWAVHFGPYSGRPPEKSRLVVLDPLKPRTVSPAPGSVTAGSVAAMSVEGEEPDAGSSVAEAPAAARAELGEGDAMDYSGGEEEVRRLLELLRDVVAVAAHHDAQADTLAPALARVRGELAAMEAAFRSGSAVELLRAAECRGDGVLFLGEKGVPDEGGALEVPGRRAEAGDVLVAEGGAVYLVVGTDEEGRVTRLAGEPEVTESGKVRAGGVRGKTLRYFWSPAREPRAWTGPDAPVGEYADLPAALAQLVGLWGEREGRRRDLSVAGDFVAEVLTAAGLAHRGLAGSDRDGVLEHLDRLGEGVRPLGKKDSPAPAAGDLVRLRKDGPWGVCTRVRGPGEPVDVLFQGGLPGHAGEEEDAVVLQHAVEMRRLSHLWRPSAARRKGG